MSPEYFAEDPSLFFLALFLIRLKSRQIKNMTKTKFMPVCIQTAYIDTSTQKKRKTFKQTYQNRVNRPIVFVDCHQVCSHDHLPSLDYRTCLHLTN